MHSTIVSTRSATITTQRLSLNGLRVLNTRPKHQAAKLSQTIQAAGGIAIELPTLEISPLSLDWLSRLPPLTTVQKAIFISTNAVHCFFSGLQSQHRIWPHTIQTFAVGAGTAAALEKQNISQIQTPTISGSEHLLALPDLQNMSQQSILLIGGESGRPLLHTSLCNQNANVYPIAVYRRGIPKINLPFTHALWQDNAVDMLIMLSQAGIDNLFHLFEESAKSWLQSKPWIVISPRLVEIAHKYQVKNVILSTYTDMVNTLMRQVHAHG